MTGLLLINLGSPAAPTTAAVRRYLAEFLSDPRVLDMNPVARWLLLHLVILPFRSPKSAAAYQKIWEDRGSPLVAHGRDLEAAVRAKLTGWRVALGMRYGAPSIASALEELAGVERLVVLPLYPQYSSASTGSSLEEVYRLLGAAWVVPAARVVDDFHDDPGFLDAFAAVGKEPAAAADHVLFSFHGLPERQIRKADATGAHCFASPDCCDRIVDANRRCYRAQCFATARELAGRLALAPERWSVSFQSRLGRDPWIRPFTDEVLPELAKTVRRLAVYSPAFVADCLETLEEIALRARDQFVAAGGESLTLVPSLNSTPAWVDAVCELARRAAGEPGSS